MNNKHQSIVTRKENYTFKI